MIHRAFIKRQASKHQSHGKLAMLWECLDIMTYITCASGIHNISNSSQHKHLMQIAYQVHIVTIIVRMKRSMWGRVYLASGGSKEAS